MSQTFGQFIVNDLLPKDLRSTDTLDKKTLYKKLYGLARQDSNQAGKTMDLLRDLGHSIATTEGISISLDDITPEYAKRDAIVKPALDKLKKTSDMAKRQVIINGVQDDMLNATKSFHGSQGVYVQSGGRGKPVQLQRMSMTPVAGRMHTGDPYPWLVTKSHAEGLRASEMISTNFETRNNQIGSNKQVTEPGDFSKILVSNMSDQLVLEEDCGTTNGISMPTDDTNIIDRFLSQPAGGFPRGTLITPQVFTRLKKSTKSVLVRSTMTCELNDGICQKCFGANEKGSMHDLGTNVGVRSAQAITEPLTQFALSAKHGVRAAGAKEKGQVEGLKGFRNFLEIPQSFTNKAILAEERGEVGNIIQAPQGGYDISIGERSYYTPPGLDVRVKKGQSVLPGDALSDGIPKPDEVVALKGMGEGRKYVVDQMYKVYKNQGLDVDKRHLEILARSHLNHVEILDDPEERFYPGELVSYPSLLKTLKQDSRSIALKKSEGKMMSQGHLHHVAGTTITPEIMKELKSKGFSNVNIARKPPTLAFAMRPIQRNPLLNPDWMARLGHRYLKDSILEGAHFGQKSNIHGTHPIPAYVYGADFGTGVGKRY